MNDGQLTLDVVVGTSVVAPPATTRRARDREKARARDAKYRASHREERRARDAARRASPAGRAADAKYRDEHCEESLARHAAYCEANREKILAQRTEYQAKHVAEVRARDAKYRAEHVAEIHAYLASPACRETQRRQAAKQRAAHPEKGKARHAVRNAIRAGRLTRGLCEHTGADCSGRIEGHHHLGYAPEHWLDVRFLCRHHHAEAHRDGVTP
jgi:hypothetical protein